MDMLNHLDTESSGDTNDNAMEDHVIEDGNHSENESDQVTRNSTQLSGSIRFLKT